MSVRKMITVYIAFFLFIAGVLKIFQINKNLVSAAVHNDLSNYMTSEENTGTDQFQNLLNDNGFNGNFLEDNSFEIFMNSLY